MMIDAAKIEAGRCDAPRLFAGGVLPHGRNRESISKFGHGGARANSGGVRQGAGRKFADQPRAPRVLGRRWHVVQMAAGAERRVIRDLIEGETRAGWTPIPAYEAMFLLTRTIRLRRGRRVPVDLPMLSGYGFVRFDAARDDWRPILSCPGVLRLFMTRSQRPIPVPGHQIAALIALSEHDLGLDPLAMPAREIGELLRVAVGPFTSFDAVVMECDGIATTAEVIVFGRPTPVTLPWAAFEAV